MKIILSRKGFDSSIQGGGNSSVIYEDQFYPIPIPEAETSIRYADLEFQDTTYLRLMKDLKISQFTECHFDPFLSEKYLPPALSNWKKSLGQSGTALTVLENSDIGVGDLFIFFGWFKKVEKKKGKYSFTKMENYTRKGIHVIYGYLQVGEEPVYLKDSEKVPPTWIETHPHYKFRDDYAQNNAIYIARDTFSENEKKPGAGIFHFNDELILTEPNSNRSKWLLPDCFHPDNGVEIKYLKRDRWEKVSDSKTRVNANFRGQELVVLEDPNNDIKDWAIDLINQNQVE